ncbi:MAG: TetR family transcriptional regulator [Saccharopolyspora sp.]|uniref:TetR/AcrR family transcriptional regulator n=1 Tax=Saccharopolyspora TaxID=1835 RepID=UPI001909A0B3|nr:MULTISPECIES: TetR/AcrR family transcriptional regulator [unclassified Saccharopolyspora]MBK0866549.1 TetR family transcriptional regulator [Saccharopolyspora sp. HNM0986]MBQ6641398.1 TetR family transcriptional regulator [Saccharopolyspora sp.]
MAETKRSTGRAQRPAAAEAGGSQRRAELLAIAADLFAERGFVVTTVREIADAAGILSGSLYYHFDSKESMVDEILREFLDFQQRLYDEVLHEKTDPRGTITELVRQSFRAMNEYRSAVTIYQNEAKYLQQFERFSYLRRAANDFERTWMKVLQQGQQAGIFRSDLNVKIAYRFIRDTVWTTVHWYNPRGRLNADVIAEQHITILCEGIMTGQG